MRKNSYETDLYLNAEKLTSEFCVLSEAYIGAIDLTIVIKIKSICSLNTIKISLV